MASSLSLLRVKRRLWMPAVSRSTESFTSGRVRYMKKLLTLLISLGLVAVLAVANTGCGKGDKKKTTTGTGTTDGTTTSKGGDTSTTTKKDEPTTTKADTTTTTKKE